MKTLPALGSTLVLLTLAYACGGETRAEPEESAGTDGGQADAAPAQPDASEPRPVDALTFGDCPRPYRGECTSVQLPLDPDQPEGETVEVFVTRFADPPGARGAVWLLQGGPGGSMAAFQDAIQGFRQAAPDLTIYGVEHRGVARSSSLECGSNPERCGARLVDSLGDALSFYSTSGAANDLHELIVRTRKPGDDVFVYGVSYGTYWAQRYLMMFPDEPTGVVLDSVVPMRGMYFSQSDREGELTARYWAEVCDQDAYCSNMMGGSAMAKMQSAFSKIGTGHCPGSVLDKDSSVVLRALLPYNELGYWILPVAYRYDRCTAEDVSFLNQLFENVFTAFGGMLQPQRDLTEDSNDALYYNVAFSELWESPPPSEAELYRRYREALLPSGAVAGYLSVLREDWPVYQDRRVGQYPQSDVPVLAMNGTLDSQTPLDEVSVVSEFYTKPNQGLVVIPYANHGVAISYPGEPASCGASIMKSFLANPRGELNTTCLAQVQPPSVRGIPEYNEYLFGVSDLWEGSFGLQRQRRFSAEVQQWAENLRARAALIGSATHMPTR